MNTLDLIVCLVLALAVWNGWRQGFVVQICSLAGIVAGIWIAARFGAQVGGWLRLDDEVAAAGGFVTALVVVILVVAIAGRVVRKVFHFAGLGVADTLLGIAVSVLKYLLVLSVLFSAFDALNEDYCLVGPRTIHWPSAAAPPSTLEGRGRSSSRKATSLSGGFPNPFSLFWSGSASGFPGRRKKRRPMDRKFTATVVRATGSWYDVLHDGETVRCRIRGRLRLKGVRSTNPVVVGDEVACEADEGGDYVIADILPRRNYVIRRASNLSKESHIIAANVDQALLMASLRSPETPTEFVDRFLVTCEAYKVPVTILLSKLDLQDAEAVAEFRAVYEGAGYRVLEVSVREGRGVEVAEKIQPFPMDAVMIATMIMSRTAFAVRIE